MGCLSCKRKFIDVVRLAQKMANLDNTTYYVYKTKSNNYHYTPNKVSKCLIRLKPMKTEEIKHIQFNRQMYRVDKFTYELYSSLTKTPTLAEYEKLTGKKHENNIRKNSKKPKQKPDKQDKSANI